MKLSSLPRGVPEGSGALRTDQTEVASVGPRRYSPARGNTGHKRAIDLLSPVREDEPCGAEATAGASDPRVDRLERRPIRVQPGPARGATRGRSTGAVGSTERIARAIGTEGEQHVRQE
jgi:hypothetical protein